MRLREQRQTQAEHRRRNQSETEVFVCSVGPYEAVLPEKLKLTARLWEAGVRSEYSYDPELNLDDQLLQARTKGIDWAVVLNYKTYFSAEGAPPTVRLRSLDGAKSEGKGRDQMDMSVDEAIRFFVERKGSGAKPDRAKR